MIVVEINYLTESVVASLPSGLEGMTLCWLT